MRRELDSQSSSTNASSALQGRVVDVGSGRTDHRLAMWASVCKRFFLVRGARSSGLGDHYPDSLPW
jgi:hypothetical protein